MKFLIRRLFFLILACLFTVVGVGQSAFADHKDILNTIDASVEADKTIGAHDLEIVCRQGEVILRGNVESDQARRRVVQIAENTDGVVSVTNWLKVTPKGSSHVSTQYRSEVSGNRTDSQIAADIKAALSADNQELANKITPSVTSGTALLRGDVSNFREADQALSTTLMVAGVSDISSELTINGRRYGVETMTR